MPADSGSDDHQPDSGEVTELLGRALNSLSIDYAFGGAIALGYWTPPRGTLDVDLTLYLPPHDFVAILETLQAIGCDVDSVAAKQQVQEHGYCRTSCRGVRVDVFLPLIEFYELARQRRQPVLMGKERIYVWSAETLAVFKLMFFRAKDRVDVAALLHHGGDQFDHAWVRTQLVTIFGARDPRLPTWDELVTAECGPR